MASVVHKEKTEWSEEVNSHTVAKDYRKAALEIALAVGKFELLSQKVKHITEVTGDAGDVGFELDEALLKLGIALASATIYADEYEKEAKGISEEAE